MENFRWHQFKVTRSATTFTAAASWRIISLLMDLVYRIQYDCCIAAQYTCCSELHASPSQVDGTLPINLTLTSHIDIYVHPVTKITTPNNRACCKYQHDLIWYSANMDVSSLYMMERQCGEGVRCKESIIVLFSGIFLPVHPRNLKLLKWTRSIALPLQSIKQEVRGHHYC